MHSTKRRTTGLGIALLLFFQVTTAEALPFEMIVPTEVDINTSGSTGVASTVWGLISPTTGMLTDIDLDNAVLTANIVEPNVTLSFLNSNPQGTFQLTPGVFAGFLASFPATDNSVFSTHLGAGESVGEFWMYQIGFTYPQSYTGTGLLNATLEIAGHRLSWSSQVNFLNAGQNFRAVSAQRLAAVVVPEPSTGLLVGLGLGAFAWRGRRGR